MENFTFIFKNPLFLSCWISVSLSEILTVEVQPGEEVTLMCNNFSSSPSNIFWYRLTSGASVSCISYITSSDKALLCDGFQNRNFIMTSNITNLFLNIKSVDVSDSGLYFCGCCKEGFSALVSPTYLKVQGKIAVKCFSDELTNLTSVILGGVTIVLVMVIIGLVATIRKLHAVMCNICDRKYFPLQNSDPDTLNYAPLSFHPKMKDSRRPEREMESNVVYAATRQTHKTMTIATQSGDCASSY
uniref:Ig-like domain-containing protein n=1 Tax=Amphiprion ocellaris TaxID=80972 RepID=A0AAQ5YSP7_AMPOC